MIWGGIGADRRGHVCAGLHTAGPSLQNRWRTRFAACPGKKIATGENRVLSISKLYLWGMAATAFLGRFMGAHSCALMRNRIAMTLRSFVGTHESALMGNRNTATLGGLVGAHEGALVHGPAFLLSPASAHHCTRFVIVMSLSQIHGRHFSTTERTSRPKCGENSNNGDFAGHCSIYWHMLANVP